MPDTSQKRTGSASENSVCAVISLAVSVPVLSTQHTVVHPSASTAGSFFTTALRFAIRITPSASVTVTTTGSPSGMAATASETPIWNMTSIGLPCTRPMSKMTAMMPKLIIDNRLPSASMRCCSGVRDSSSSSMSANTLPSSLWRPVPTTMPRPRPLRTSVPMKHMFVRFATGTSGRSIATAAALTPPPPPPLVGRGDMPPSSASGSTTLTFL
mmetsp:Transcript_17760/g.62573  ORF Transcript_17760/g.62573 Transcript_17760/m.62573 type:complete len:213 (-) Transcript_17760:748-1386(-)